MAKNWFRLTISGTVAAVTEGTECRSRQRCTAASNSRLPALPALCRGRARPAGEDPARPGQAKIARCLAGHVEHAQSRPPPVRCAARAAVPYAVPGPDPHSRPRIKDRGDRAGRAQSAPTPRIGGRVGWTPPNQSYKRRLTGQARWNLKIARRRSADRPLCADAPRS